MLFSISKKKIRNKKKKFWESLEKKENKSLKNKKLVYKNIKKIGDWINAFHENIPYLLKGWIEISSQLRQRKQHSDPPISIIIFILIIIQYKAQEPLQAEY